MGDLNRQIARARVQASLAASARWNKHAGERRIAQERIKVAGPGAGDTPQRVSAYQTRRRAVIERVIGTVDFTTLAPTEVARAAALPVARITTSPQNDGSAPEGFATGFLVSPRLLMTNHHVFPFLDAARNCSANFLYEKIGNGTSEGVYFALQPDDFYYADEFLDIALVAVVPENPQGRLLREFGHTPMIASAGKILTGKPVHIIQHPGGGVRQYAVKNNPLVGILDEGFLHYETDTNRGSSGAPAFNEDWELVAVHHCGIPRMSGDTPLKKNGDPWDEENESDELIDWIANEGARVSSIIAHLSGPLQVAGKREYLEELLHLSKAAAAAPPGTAILAAAPELAARAGTLELSGRGSTPASDPLSLPDPVNSLPFLTTPPTTTAVNPVFNISGPVTINIGAPAPIAAAAAGPGLQAGAAALAVETAKALEVKQSFDPRYASREGYDPGFLGVEVPPPTVAAERLGELYTVEEYKAFAASSRLVPKVNTDGLVDAGFFPLHYYYYSICFNREFRTAMWTASNADYRAEMRTDPRGRKQFGGEDWKPDPRVPVKLQLLNEDIYGPAQNFDRGHLVRREDSCWGAPGEVTAFANADTYHLTNCTAQHELFNQESPMGNEYRGRKGVWGHLENTLQNQVTKGGGQMTIFAGPVLDGSCRSEDFGTGVVRYPLRFWKVIIVPESQSNNPKLLAYGFVLDQEEAIDEFGIGFTKESLDLAKFGKEKKSLKNIEKIADVRFAAILHQADQHL